MTPAERIYLDHAAATPLDPEVAAAIDAVRESGFANPSSPHAAGRDAKRLLEDARERILALCARDLGPGARLVFTSGATESNRCAVLGMARGPAGTVLSSARDHASLAAAARDLAARGWEAAAVPLAPDGTLALAPACPGDRADPRPRILCVTLACGQSGTWDDVPRIAAWAAAGADRRVHVDATQAWCAAGPGPFGLPDGTAATLAFAPHKFGGPRGIGCLLVRRDVELAAVAPGTQEAGLRGGTEAVALAVGCARAVERIVADRADLAGRLAALRERLEARLVAAARAVGIPARVVGAAGTRACHIVTIAFPGLDRQALVIAADLEGVCCATGTACASGSSEPAPALVAMGMPAAEVAGAVRLSLGRRTSAADVDAAVERLARVLARMARRPTA